MLIRFDRTVTVLDPKGDIYGAFNQYYGKGEKIRDIDIRIYDQNGDLVTKVKPSEIKDLPADDGFSLYTDSRIKYYRPAPNFYPYTIRVVYSFKTPNTAIIPSFIPVYDYYLGVQKSTFIVSHPPNIKLFTSFKSSPYFHLQKTETNTLTSYTLQQAAPLYKEPFSPSFFNLVPVVKFRLNRFSLMGITGRADSWKEMGDWIVTHLLNGVNSVSSATKNEILKLIRTAKGPKEQAERIYEYMQRKTRYVSIQIGVGGWRPMPAYEVDQKAYGDCKALVNYTKSLMDIAGIKTFYTLVYAGTKRNIDSQVVGIQGNHAILMFPYQKDTIWMECTNHQIPFGFLGSFTDDRQVLVVKSGDSKIVKTPAYKDTENIIFTGAQITVDSTLGLHAQTQIRSCGLAYEKTYFLDNLKKNEIALHYKQKLHYIPGLNLYDVRFLNDKKHFCFTEQFQFHSKNYFIEFIDNEYIFRPNMFSVFENIPPETKKRKFPVYIRNGFIHHDSIRFYLPAGITFAFVPENKKIESRFGSYEVTFNKISDNQIIYERILRLRAGTYPKETYEELRKFFLGIHKYDKKKIAIKKIEK